MINKKLNLSIKLFKKNIEMVPILLILAILIFASQIILKKLRPASQILTVGDQADAGQYKKGDKLVCVSKQPLQTKFNVGDVIFVKTDNISYFAEVMLPTKEDADYWKNWHEKFFDSNGNLLNGYLLTGTSSEGNPNRLYVKTITKIKDILCVVASKIND